MQVYIEWLLFDNAMMNYLILRAAAMVARMEMRKGAIWVVSVLGACVSAMAMRNPALLSFPVKAALLLLMSIPFKAANLAQFGRACGCVLGATFLMGGMAYAVAFLMDGSFVGGVLYASNSVRAVLVSAFLATQAPRTLKKLVSAIKLHSIHMKLRITTACGVGEIDARIDTGNNLSTAMENLPIIVVDRYAAKAVIPKEWASGDWKEHPIRGMGVISFKTVQGGGVMPTLPARVERMHGGEWMQGGPCRIALSPQPLSDCGALINAQWQ